MSTKYKFFFIPLVTSLPVLVNMIALGLALTPGPLSTSSPAVGWSTESQLVRLNALRLSVPGPSAPPPPQLIVQTLQTRFARTQPAAQPNSRSSKDTQIFLRSSFIHSPRTIQSFFAASHLPNCIVQVPGVVQRDVLLQEVCVMSAPSQ